MVYRRATLEDSAQVAVLYRDLAFHIKHTSKDPYWDFEEMPLDLTEGAVKEYIENEGSKEAWNGMGYECFREQAIKCVE